MATKDISDTQVLNAYLATGPHEWPYDVLQRTTGQPFKVCWRAMERAYRHGLLEYGTSLRSGWVTEKGYTLMREST